MNKKKRKKDDFRQLACEARNRLKNGYWSVVKSERATDIQKAESEGRDPERIKEYYRNKFDADFRRKTQNGQMPDDELFYQKVVDILESGELITNPIGRLIDGEIFESLETAARQRYVLEIADKYRKMCERYQKEKTLKNYLVH